MSTLLSEIDDQHMRRALELARRGQGWVEPNPMVGCVIARQQRVCGEGWHARYGDSHAEVVALQSATESVAGATMYVTLEPCSHHGKTPPCVDAILSAGIRRVVVAMPDPYPKVSGRGIKILRDAGVLVDVGLLEADSNALNAPYLMLTRQQRPWVLAKWAMSLDGKIATRTGDSQWISNEHSRAIVHAIRGRMDAIIVGRQTCERDDPRLTARPAGPRTAARIVFDSRARLRPTNRLIATIDDAPVILVVGPDAAAHDCQRLRNVGCQIITVSSSEPGQQVRELLARLGQQRYTNVLVEGGGKLLGSFFQEQVVDEVHTFVSTRIIGGGSAISPVAGRGVDLVRQATLLETPVCAEVDGDLYVSGIVAR